jgi:YVTN family beta-propeller protein
MWPAEWAAPPRVPRGRPSRRRRKDGLWAGSKATGGLNARTLVALLVLCGCVLVSAVAALGGPGLSAAQTVNCGGCHLFVTNSLDNSVSVYDIQGTPTVLPSLPAGNGPFGVAVVADQH